MITKTRLAVIVAVIALLGAAGSFWAYQSKSDEIAAYHHKDSDRAAALDTGSKFLAAVFSANQPNLDDWNNSVTNLTTDELHSKLADLKDLYTGFVKSQMTMSCKTTGAAVIESDDTKVKILAVVEETVSGPQQPKPLVTDDALYVSLMKIGSGWKVFDYKAATGLTPGALPAPQDPGAAPR